MDEDLLKKLEASLQAQFPMRKHVCIKEAIKEDLTSTVVPHVPKAVCSACGGLKRAYGKDLCRGCYQVRKRDILDSRGITYPKLPLQTDQESRG